MPFVAYISLKMQPELKQLVDRMAGKQDLASSEYVVRVLAAHFGKPKLGVIPRRRWGMKPRPVAVK